MIAPQFMNAVHVMVTRLTFESKSRMDVLVNQCSMIAGILDRLLKRINSGIPSTEASSLSLMTHLADEGPGDCLMKVAEAGSKNDTALRAVALAGQTYAIRAAAAVIAGNK